MFYYYVSYMGKWYITVMTGRYLYWQFVSGPAWLITFSLTAQRALARYFSASFMLRTLISHWHKDAVPYHGGGISKIALALAWNLISRAVGMFIRTIVLAGWIAVAGALLFLSLVLLIFFMAWPWLVAASLTVGTIMLM